MTTRTSRFIGHSLLFVVLLLFAVVMALPFYWALITAIRPDRDIFSLPISWIPRVLTLDHFVETFTTIPYFRYFVNSLILAVGGVVANLFFGSLGGFAFAKLRFRGKGIIFRALLASMMIPGIVTLIPQFLILRGFPFVGGNDFLGRGGVGLLNSYWAVILPGAAGAMAVFLMRQFFLTLPDELAEAARIEGAGEFRIFRRVYMPLTLPALATLGIFTFQVGWNQFLWPMVVLNDPTMATIQMGLQAFSFNHSTQYGAMMAGSVIAVLPILVLFFFAQRFFIQGIAFTGVKG